MSERFFQYAIGTSAGSLSPRTNWNSLAKFEFALPTNTEQLGLASVLSEMKNSIEHLEEIGSQADQLIGSYLKSLFWNQSLSDDRCIKTDNYRLPSNWQLKTLPELVKNESSALTAGPFGTIFKAKDFRSSGIPIIQLRHVTKQGFSWGENVTYMDVEVYNRLHKPYTTRGGDLLITKMGEPPGLACLYPYDEPDGMVTPDVIKATLDENIVLPGFMVLAFNNVHTQKAIMKFTKGGTRTRVSLDNFYSIQLPIPPISEQEKILEFVRNIQTGSEDSSRRAQNLKDFQNSLINRVLGGQNEL